MSQTSTLSAPAQPYTRIYPLKDIPLPHAAYAEIGPAPDGTAQQDLWVTSFAAFGGGSVYRMPLDKAVDPKDTSAPDVFTSQISWPNDLAFKDGSVYVGSGFLVPGQSTGAISKLPLDGKSDPVKLTNDKRGWFYHRPFVLSNGDILTARATKPLLGGSPEGELVLIHPQPDGTGPGTEEVLASGPDMHLTVADLKGDGQQEVLAPEFFGGKLSLFTQQEGGWKETVIDPDLGPGFDCQVVKLQGDKSKPVLLATNNTSSGGGVYAYEIPDQLTQGPWVKHTLVEGIPDAKSGAGTGAPGVAQAFFPGPHAEGDKPGVLVSTDDGESLMWGMPSTDSWNYQFYTTGNLNSTVGRPAVTPFKDAEGYPYLLVPLYDTGVVRVYSFNPKYQSAPSTVRPRA